MLSLLVYAYQCARNSSARVKDCSGYRHLEGRVTAVANASCSMSGKPAPLLPAGNALVQLAVISWQLL